MNCQIGLTAALVVLVGACGGAVPNTSSPTSSTPSAGSTAPAIASGGGPTASPKTGVVELPSASVTDRPRSSGSPFATATSKATASATATIPAGAQIDARIDVGAPVSPRWFASDGQSLWVHEPTSLVRLDVTTSAITGEVPMNAIEYGYATTGAGAVWQTDFGRDVLVKIDPVADTVVASIPLGSGTAPEGVAVTAGSVWVAGHGDGTIARVDPATSVVTKIPTGPTGLDNPETMTAGPNGVFVDVASMYAVLRIDPATNRVGLSVPRTGTVASDGKEVWIGTDLGPNGLPQAVRIDPVSGKVITAVDLNTTFISALGVGLGSVWVTTGDGLFRIDSASGEIVGRLDIGVIGDVLVAGGAVWVSAFDQPYVLRILPLDRRRPSPP